MNLHDILTLVRDPRFPLGKQFSRNADGSVAKESAVSISLGIAMQHHVPDIHALQRLIHEVSEDTHAAIINATFPSIPVGTEFLILSEKEFLKRGIGRYSNEVRWPVTISYDEHEYPALGRFKEHTAASTWLLLDRDIDEHTPPYYADLDYDVWLAEIDKLLPGISKCTRLRAHSSSARVSIDGIPVGGGNGHTWIQLSNAADVERLRSVVKARAIAMNMTWKKPRHSRKTGEVVRHDVVSIIDWSVFTPGRLVFVGKPVAQHV
jgi:hypothetical protein